MGDWMGDSIERVLSDAEEVFRYVEGETHQDRAHRYIERNSVQRTAWRHRHAVRRAPHASPRREGGHAVPGRRGQGEPGGRGGVPAARGVQPLVSRTLNAHKELNVMADARAARADAAGDASSSWIGGAPLAQDHRL